MTDDQRTETLREGIARTLYESAGYLDTPWERIPEAYQETYRRDADAVLAYLKSRGIKTED